MVECVPAGTMTESDPSDSSVLLLDNKTSVPPAGAAWFNVTVHVVDVPEFKLLGLQTSWETEIVRPKARAENKKTLTPVTATLLLMRSNSDLAS